MIKKSFIAVVTILLLVISILAELQVFEVVEANPYYPPIWKVESPQNNTIYNTNNINLTLIVESDFKNYDFYYSLDTAITSDMQSLHDGDEGVGKVPINVTLFSEIPINSNGWNRQVNHFSTQLYNLSDGQHVLTLWHGYYDFILTDWRHEHPSATINFSIDPTAPSLTPTPTPTAPYLPPNDRNAPHLEPTFYLIPVSVIVAVVIVLSLLLYRRHRKTVNLSK
jgi:hypothetical protein